MKKIRSAFFLALLAGLLSAAALFRFGRAPEVPAENELVTRVVHPIDASTPQQKQPLPATWAAPPAGPASSESCPACPGDASHTPPLPGTPASAADAQATTPAGLPEVQPTPEEERVIREKLAPFERWAQRLDTPEATVLAAQTLETGKKLAQQRREALKLLIRSHPQLALRQALPYAVRMNLPPEVQGLVEQPVSGKGDLLVAIGLRDGPGAPPPLQYLAQFGPAKTYQAYVYGRRAEQTTRMNVSVHGVAVDRDLAVSESPLRVLDPGEPPRAGKAQAEKRCPVSGKDVTENITSKGGSREVVAESGDTVYSLCSGLHLAALAAQVTAQEAVAAAPLALVSGNRKVAVLLVNYLDGSYGSYSPAEVNNMMFAAPDSVNAAYTEMSFNRLSFSGNTYGPFAINQNVSSVTLDMSAVDLAATAAGVDLSSCQHKVYILPGNSPIFNGGAIGLGGLGGNATWIHGSYGLTRYVQAHELGHNLGMNHASTPPSNEYGDPTDFMGSNRGLPHVNGPHKVQLGWAQWTSVTASGTYTISPLEQSGLGPQVLVFPKPDTSECYFVSFRMPVGFDASQLSPSYTNKVSLHRWKGAFRMGAYNTFFLQALNDGQTFTDSTNGISIGLVSHDATHATVSVTVSNSNAAPLMLSQLASQTVTAGQTATFSVEAVGTAPLSYQWLQTPWWKTGDPPVSFANIPGATGASYTTPATTLADAGKEKLLRVVVSNVAGSITSNDVQLTVTSPSGPVAYWKLDESMGTLASDYSGNGNTGTLVNGPLWTAGKVGSALSFDGVNDYVEAGSGASLNLTAEVSVAAWVKLSATGRDQKIAGNQSGAAGGYKLGVFGSDNKVEFEIRDAANVPYLNRGAPGGTALAAGTWVHVAGVYSRAGGFIRTYVNGTLDREVLTGGVLAATPGSFKLGREPFSAGSFFGGLLDDVRVYNRALTGTESAALAKWPKAMKRDFDGDGKADLLFRHSSSGEVHLWLLK